MWTEFYSSDSEKTLAFMEKNFGIKKVATTESAGDIKYNVIRPAGSLWPTAGVMDIPVLPDGSQISPSTMIYITVENYHAAHDKIVADGAVPHIVGQVAGGMRFGVYTIPGGLVIGVAEYGVK